MPEPLRFTFVVTRYGAGLLGGAEKHARDVAERLAARGHEVRVLTTCARSYTTWANELPAGIERSGGVEVHRFRVVAGRKRPLDGVAKELASRLRGVGALARLWSRLQGPVVPELVRACVADAERRDLLVFFSWLYQPVQEALSLVGDRSALVPLVHDEPPLHTSLARATLRAPRMLLVNTEEEWARIRGVTGDLVPPAAIVAVGCDPPPPRAAGFTPPTADPYLLLLGRAAKTRPMLGVWRELLRGAGVGSRLELDDGRRVAHDRLKLVTAGEASRMYDGMPGVLQLGFVDDATRWQLIRHAIALVSPSVHESLSLVLLEAWGCGVPAVVHSGCDVTAGQARRSGGGFGVDFTRPSRAAAAICRGLSSRERRMAMGSAGRDYVARRYRWDHVAGAYEAAARAVRSGLSVRRALLPWSGGAVAPEPPGIEAP